VFIDVNTNVQAIHVADFFQFSHSFYPTIGTVQYINGKQCLYVQLKHSRVLVVQCLPRLLHVIYIIL